MSKRKTSGFSPTESFNLEGQWWVPSNPDRKIGGILEFEPESGISLRLLDALELPDFGIGGVYVPDDHTITPIIHGQTFNGPSEVTLLEAESWSWIMPPFPTMYQNQSYRARWCLMGQHVTEEAPCIETVFLQVTGLDRWSGSDGMTISFERPPGANSFTVDWVRPEPLEARPAGGPLTITWSPHIDQSKHRIAMEPSPIIRVDLDSQLTIDEVLKDICGPLRDLSSFLMQAPMQVKSLRVALVSDDEDNQQASEIVFGTSPPDMERANLVPLLSPAQTDFGTIIERWFGLYDDDNVRAALARHFSRGYRPGFVEDRLLDVAGVLEALSPEQLAEDPDRLAVEEIVSTILSTVASADISTHRRQALAARAEAFGNPSLRPRITELLEPIRESTSTLISSPSRFARRLTDLRNKISHGDTLHGESTEGFWLATAGEFIIVALLLDRIGISQKDIAQAFRQHSSYNHAVESCQPFKWGGVPESRTKRTE